MPKRPVHVLGHVRAQRLPGDALDREPEPVGVDAVLPDGARIVDQRRVEARPLALQRAGEARRGEVVEQPLVDEEVAEAGRVGHQLTERRLAGRRHAESAGRRRSPRSAAAPRTPAAPTRPSRRARACPAPPAAARPWWRPPWSSRRCGTSSPGSPGRRRFRAARRRGPRPPPRRRARCPPRRPRPAAGRCLLRQSSCRSPPLEIVGARPRCPQADPIIQQTDHRAASRQAGHTAEPSHSPSPADLRASALSMYSWTRRILPLLHRHHVRHFHLHRDAAAGTVPGEPNPQEDLPAAGFRLLRLHPQVRVGLFPAPGTGSMIASIPR